jgi:hypothetical protein
VWGRILNSEESAGNSKQQFSPKVMMVFSFFVSSFLSLGDNSDNSDNHHDKYTAPAAGSSALSSPPLILGPVTFKKFHK